MTSLPRLALLCLLAAASLGFASAAVSAQPSAPEDRRLISVIGEGVIRAKPDMATIELGVVAEAADAAAALEANSASMQRIAEALKAEGIEARDLQTSNFSVEPRYSQPPQDPGQHAGWSPQIIGYAVRNSLNVRIRDLDSLGSVLDRVVRLGANSISGPTFTVADPAKLEAAARAAAIRDAKARADTFAGAAGISLGEITRIEETGYGMPEPMPMVRAMKAEAFDASVPIEGGELTFTARVAMSWRLAE